MPKSRKNTQEKKCKKSNSSHDLHVLSVVLTFFIHSIVVCVATQVSVSEFWVFRSVFDLLVHPRL